ncbi:SH3 domain-containing protein [Hymenobacter sp. HDW8]|uniref:SH3 domain-containing protein n=1 Tax=Hymenobacter sp. HDW8 TaxID=2714932 RepID=UPI00140814DF|nr:SH3 domain-containing protein [Hymenobacter sp. HDW8]QIL78138.1 SH3 domain-containing protein [Hymenobacter sp. HDW8]QIL78308.1 SH3 domain-containing protein [Hymenobacter sp. HDW8]
MERLVTFWSRCVLYFTFVIVAGSTCFAQVSVRGYYRKNGTYVQPHQRTRPNHTVTDNYSYPGNYNPNKAGTSSTPSSGGSGSSNANGSANRSPEVRGQATDQPVANSYAMLPGVYRLDATMPVSVRAQPNIDASEVYLCPRNATVSVLEDTNETYCKVLVNGHTGYLSKRLLTSTMSTSAPYMAPATEPVTAHKPPLAPTWKPSSSAEELNYRLITTFNSPMDPPLRAAPDINAEEVYTCPKTATVYVLGEPQGPYCKVAVNGRIGYVAVALLQKSR